MEASSSSGSRHDSWMHAAAILAIALVALALGPSPSSAGCESVEQPNILLILMDDVGIEHLEVYGLQGLNPIYANTPNLTDVWSEDWLMFTNAWSNPVCSPTRSTILSGLYGSRTGVGELVGDDSVLGPRSGRGRQLPPPAPQEPRRSVLRLRGGCLRQVAPWHV